MSSTTRLEMEAFLDRLPCLSTHHLQLGFIRALGWVARTDPRRHGDGPIRRPSRGLPACARALATPSPGPIYRGMLWRNPPARSRRSLEPLKLSMTAATARASIAALGVAAFLILGLVAVGARSTAAAAQNDPVRVVALLNVQFLNDHADLEPTTNAERVRLASIESLFKAKLEASGRYKFVSVPADAAEKIAAGPEVGACGGCEFEYGKQLGAAYAAWIVVQKVSDLILNINVYMADIAARKLTFVHSTDIRGNTDESWTRGITYLVKNYLSAGQ